MKLKLDENIHRGVADRHLAQGQDVSTVHQEGLAGHADRDVARAVQAEGRCLITFDLDFADTRRYPPGEVAGLVVLRLRRRTAAAQVERVLHFVADTPEVASRLWIVEDDRTRDWTP